MAPPVAQCREQGAGAAADAEDPPPGHVAGQVKDDRPGVVAVDEVGLSLGRVRLREAVVVVGHDLLSRPRRVLKIRSHAANPGTTDRSGYEQHSGRTLPDAAPGSDPCRAVRRSPEVHVAQPVASLSYGP